MGITDAVSRERAGLTVALVDASIERRHGPLLTQQEAACPKRCERLLPARASRSRTVETLLGPVILCRGTPRFAQLGEVQTGETVRGLVVPGKQQRHSGSTLRPVQWNPWTASFTCTEIPSNDHRNRDNQLRLPGRWQRGEPVVALGANRASSSCCCRPPVLLRLRRPFAV